ncbi:MAG TPA: DUF3108 domain-containing protein [Desulfuromonadaceae bacterium]|jgi:hypothetical protein
MNTPPNKIRTLTAFIGLSILVHLLVLFSLGRFGNYSFAAPVNPLQAVMVDLMKPSADASPVTNSDDHEYDHTDKVTKAEKVDDGNNAPLQREEISTPPPVMVKSQVEAEPVKPAVIEKEKAVVFTPSSEPTKDSPPTPSQQAALATVITPPIRTAGEFLTTKSEKLSYLVSLLGIPVGSAELEAKNENEEVRITLRVKSNAALASIYPVNDFFETRHIAGNFVITKISKQEGDSRSDIGFTLFLRDKRVFWFDRIRNRYSNEKIPNSEVLDALSGFFSLRNKALQIGQTETLHIYDGDNYAPLPIEIVRREMIRLPNLRKIDTLVIRPVKKNNGNSKNTSNLLIWLTNDENKVPVKVETSLPVGRVTAELISAESEP